VGKSEEKTAWGEVARYGVFRFIEILRENDGVPSRATCGLGKAA